MTDELKTLRSVLDLCSHGLWIADKLNSLQGVGLQGFLCRFCFYVFGSLQKNVGVQD